MELQRTGHSAVASNARYKQLIAGGTRGLSLAFDLPTQTGHDSDAPIASGEVGRAGVAIDSIEDMRILFGGIPLDKVSTSMTVSTPGALPLLLSQLVGEEQGVTAGQLTGTIRNDVLKEYLAHGTSPYPPAHARRLIADILTYCKAEIPQWNTLPVSGRHLAAAGASPTQVIAFTLAGAIAYVRTAVGAGMDVDDFAPCLSFDFVARMTALEERATLRAARRIWARVLKEEFGAVNPTSQTLRLYGTDRTASLGPFAGGHVIERMTDDVEATVLELMGSPQPLTGPGGTTLAEEEPRALLGVDRTIERQQTERLAKLRAWRFTDRVHRTLAAVQDTAGRTGNLLYPMKEALAAGATIGEVCDALREVWGTYASAAGPSAHRQETRGAQDHG